MRLYLDGSQEGGDVSKAGWNLSNNNSLKIGATRNLSADHWFKGRIDEVRVYNRALSGEEIQALYENGLGGFGDYHLQEGSPCIDAGDPDFEMFYIKTDIDGQHRVMGYHVDMGADEFVIPMLVVTKPQGGEVWTTGSIHKIEWLSYEAPGLIDIYYSDNNGIDWVLVEEDAANTGKYIWYLPEIIDSNQCSVLAVPGEPDINGVFIESSLFTIHPDSPGPVVESQWISLGEDFKRAGSSDVNGPELGCVKWEFETDGPVSASVTVGVEGRVHIPCEDGNVYTVDANGVLLWSCNTDSPILSSPTIRPDGTIYVGNQDGKLYAIDIDGDVRWTYGTDGPIYSSPAVSEEGEVYVCTETGILYALGEDGSKLWSFETSGPGKISNGAIFASPAVDSNGTVYIGGLYDPNLYALDGNDGSLKWVCTFGSGGWPFASPVVGRNGVIYQTLLYDANLYAIDSNDGHIIWATYLSDTLSGG